MKTNKSHSFYAISSLLSKNQIIPSTIKLPDVSPGWTLPVMITHYLYDISCSSDRKFVIKRQSKSLPATVFPSVNLHKIGQFKGVITDRKKYLKSVKV